ncbi:MAG TPA: S8 family serine peptidase, partial [Pseudonocardiaceae bacterium]
RGFPDIFQHPSAGRSELDPRRVAVRWRAGADEAAKRALIEELGLQPATLGESERRPLPSINRTDGLWWVQRADTSPLDEETIDRLEASDLVEWAAPSYRGSPREAAAGTPVPADVTVFAVNPTRLYVRSQAVEAIGGLEAARLAPDPDRSSRLPGYQSVRVRAGTSISAAQALSESLGARDAATASAVRLETIPFVSPTACGPKAGSALRDCSPPAGEFTPDDPRFGLQWGLQRIEVPRAWQIVRGDPSVVVAVIDQGVELAHPDLDLYPQSWNASTDTPDGSPTGNHGTACAGIIGARLDNALGVAGVAGGSKIMAIATATWADVDIAEGLYFAADNGARVVSMSFGVYGGWDFDLIRDALQYAHDKGLLLVAASHNFNLPLATFPASDGRTVCVGGSNRSDERKRIGDASAEPGWGANYGPDLDVVAPCLEIPTTDRLGVAGYDPGDYVNDFNGTSAATPHVAGLGALLFSLRPDFDGVAVRNLIESTCDKISPALYSYGNVATKPSGTWNEEVGYGRVNAERALLAACAAGGGEAECEDCGGCGGRCEEPTPPQCRGPRPVPWLPFDRCQYFYESRVFGLDRLDQGRLEIRVTYEHCLRLLGRQQGPLLYTTTLLPGETFSIYEFDRYRRVRAAEERMSVHTSFRQTMSALSQTRRFASQSAYVESLVDIRTHADTSVSAGGGLAGFFGAPQVRGEFGVATETSLASGASVRTVAEQFTQNAITAAQSTEAERSTVISTFEDAEHREATRRTFRNDNHCHAVTYFVRRVMEVYEASSRVESIEWRIGDTPWRSIDDLSEEAERLVRRYCDVLPKRHSEARDRRQITLPTDGTLYEAELAYCSSCESTREARERIELEEARLRSRRACIETEQLAADLRAGRRSTGDHATSG